MDRVQAVADFLAHNGVKGMRWGVVKDPDRQSTAKQTSEERAAAVTVKREGKAQKYVKRAAGIQSRIDELQNKEYKFAYSKKYADDQVADLQKVKQQALRDAEAKRNGKLSRGQKQVLVGAAVVGAIILASAAYTAVDSGEAHRSITKGKAFVQGRKVPEFNKKAAFADKTLDADGIFDKVVKGINPNYGAPGTTQNCRRATFTYEMRRRGFDVQATKTNAGYGQTVGGLVNALSPGQRLVPTQGNKLVTAIQKEQYSTAKHRAKPITDIAQAFSAGGKTSIAGTVPVQKSANLFTKAGPTKVPSGADILNALAKEPNGSRGELGVVWKAGGGHSMAYEIINGKPVIFDTQAGKKITNVQEAVAHGMDVLSSAAFTRLDNVPLNEDYLLRWMKNAK